MLWDSQGFFSWNFVATLLRAHDKLDEVCACLKFYPKDTNRKEGGVEELQSGPTPLEM